MNTKLTESSRQIRAEAASWVTRLHGPQRDAALEAGLRRWLAQGPEHARAFELATEVWQETAELPDEPARHASVDRARPRRLLRPTIAAAAAILVVVAGLSFYLHSMSAMTFATGVGEQRTVTLSDGTRVELNTRSEIAVNYDERARRVVMQRGEVYFDVASNKERPFIVVAGEREIIALGTEFLVRRNDDEVTVTLLEGRVAVSPVIANERSGEGAAADVHVLQPGQRLHLDAMAPPVLDVPSLQKVIAWQRGQVIFEDTPLSEAAAEFNRYTTTAIVLDSEVGGIRVGGTFRVGDVASFAHAVADSHGLEVIDSGRQLLLTRGKTPAP